jgi:tetratricopeptide (TPR) repeat protein
MGQPPMPSTTLPDTLIQEIDLLTRQLDAILPELVADRANAAPSAPEDLEALYELAWDTLHQSRMDEALDRFVDLAIAAPTDRRFQWGAALCLHHFGLIEDAARHYGICFVLDPSDAACSYRIGECLEARGLFEDAREAWSTAIQLCEVPGANPDIRALAQAGLDRLP